MVKCKLPLKVWKIKLKKIKKFAKLKKKTWYLSLEELNKSKSKKEK